MAWWGTHRRTVIASNDAVQKISDWGFSWTDVAQISGFDVAIIHRWRTSARRLADHARCDAEDMIIAWLDWAEDVTEDGRPKATPERYKRHTERACFEALANTFIATYGRRTLAASPTAITDHLSRSLDTFHATLAAHTVLASAA